MTDSIAVTENDVVTLKPTVRKRLYAWLLDPNIPGNNRKSVDRFIGGLIVLNLFALMFEHVPAIFDPHKQMFHWFDVLSVGVFTAEYLMRFYLAPEDENYKDKRLPRLAYALSPFALIDFLAVAPFYLQAFLPLDLRVLRVLRLLRILKLFRVLIPAYKEFLVINSGRTYRQKMHALIFPSNYGGSLQEFFEGFIVFWVVVSVIAVVLESVQSIHYILHMEFLLLDMVAVTIFTVEYCMRIYCCVEEPGFQEALTGRLKQATTFSSIVDLMAILPFFLEVFLHHLIDLRFLRVFRLGRLLKLTRYTSSANTLTIAIVREWPVMAAAVFVMLLLVVMTASLGYLFEHDAQPDKFENIPTSIYWAVITLASVGYGDISPVTPAGRFMTIILAFLGIGIFALPAALLSSAFTDQLQKERAALKGELYKMLDDGIISPEEKEIIDREAKRLHLSEEEVEEMLAAARAAREKSEDFSDLTLHQIATNPVHAVEHYKSLLGEIRTLGLLTDQTQFESAAIGKDRLTQTDLGLWRKINGVSPPA